MSDEIILVIGGNEFHKVKDDYGEGGQAPKTI